MGVLNQAGKEGEGFYEELGIEPFIFEARCNQADRHCRSSFGGKRVVRRLLVFGRVGVCKRWRRKRNCVRECKCCKRMELAGWLQEAETERGNDDAEYGIVIHKRKGCGEKSLGRSYATMELDTLLAIIAGGSENLED